MPQSKKKKTLNYVDEAMLKYLASYEKRQDDEDQLFAKYIAATLGRFTKHQKAQAKLQIQQVLNNIEFPPTESLTPSYPVPQGYSS